MGFGVWGLGADFHSLARKFRVQDSGLVVWGLGFEVGDLGERVWSLGVGVWGLGFVWFGVWDSGFVVQGLGFRVEASISTARLLPTSAGRVPET